MLLTAQVRPQAHYSAQIDAPHPAGPLLESITSAIEFALKDYLDSGDAESPSEINNGSCADFSDFVSRLFPRAIIHGIYDVEDIPLVPGSHSEEFVNAVAAGNIGHTALCFDGRFFDSECPHGTLSFESLPVNRRAMGMN